MGWSWEHIIAYGLYVKPKEIDAQMIKKFLERYSDIINYLEVEPEVIFVYVNSTYEIINQDSGSYSFSSPDSNGDPFNEPKHPIFQEKLLDKPKPKLTNQELVVLDKLKEIYNCSDLEYIWINDARTYY